MLKRKSLSLSAVFGLLTILTDAAQAAANSANVPITYLAFTITTAGTYVLKSNLTYPSTTAGPAISVSGVITGPVIIDLKGFTLTGSGNFSSGPAAIAITALNQYPNDFPITVQNGPVTLCVLGLNALNETAISRLKT
jgi:hypothetical protein